MSINLNIHSRGKPWTTLALSPDSSVKQLKQALQKKHPKYYPERQRFVLSTERGAPALQDNQKLNDLNLKEGSVVHFKDLGPQVGYQTVFIIEYLGPFLLYPLFYFLRNAIYGDIASTPVYHVQTVALGAWSFHYLKRLLETVFVHRFSHDTMPIFNLFKNSSYYWGFAAFVSYFVNHPLYTSPSDAQIYVSLAIFVIAEISNAIVHIQLRNLRPANSRERKIPRGFLFNFVSCPNYTMEILAWFAFSVMTQSLPALIFTVCGAFQMIVWAIQKHKRYLKEFTKDSKEGPYPRRKIIFPFVF